MRGPAMPAAVVPMNVRRSAAKREDRRRMVPFAGADDGGREVRMIRRIGEVLRLETERRAFLIDAADFSRQRAVEEITGVELQSGLARRPVARPSTRGIFELRGMPH